MKASNWKTSWFPALLLLLALTGAAAAQEAQETQNPDTDLCLQDGECSSHFRQGRRLSKAGQLDAAVEEYRIAYQRRAAPWLLFNIGRTLHKLGRMAEAVSYYQRFLATDQSNNAEWQSKARGFLAEAQAAAQAQSQSQQPTPAAAVVATGPSPEPPKRPIYKRWWFWTVMGAVVAGGVITGVLLGTRPVTPASAEVYQPTF